MQKAFRKFAERASVAVGTHWAFMIAIGIIGTWGATGPLFGFSQQWQLVVNSFTTIVRRRWALDDGGPSVSDLPLSCLTEG
jgi:low affinity Fe/Cu permease